MKKHLELRDPRSCLNRAAEDEPIFVLRANDKLAPHLVKLWAGLARMSGCGAAKTEEAEALAFEMERWAITQGSAKFPD
jgi:hypothetical protein